MTKLIILSSFSKRRGSIANNIQQHGLLRAVLVSPSSFGQVSKEPLTMLESNGFSITLNPYGRKLTADEVISHGADCIGIIAGVEPLTSEVLKRLPKLKCISRVGVGLENIDLEMASSLGIAVLRTLNGPTQAVAELTLGLAIALLRKIPMAHGNLRKGTWKKEMGSLLSGKIIGIVGLGRIGRRVAEIFLRLDCSVIANDPNPDSIWLGENEVTLVSLDDLLATSDIVTLHLDISPTNPPLLSYDQLDRMKNSAILLNLARGEAIDENALYEALSERKISGAGLDVYIDEPYEGKLTSLKNVVLTPHLGSYARESRLQMEIDAVRNLIGSLKGSRPAEKDLL